MTRLLSRIGFTSRKETVSQSIPNNWKDLSITFSKSTREFFIEKGVDVIVCADQTFIKYLLADDNLLVPTGVKRVGTTV